MSGPPPRTAIITVGDELLAGRVVDTHAAHLSRLLAPLGIPVLSHRTVGDAQGALAAALLEEAGRVDTVILAGGLGPTEDDRTRAECAAAAGVALEFRPEWWVRIEERLQRFGVRVSDRNRRQAEFPVGSTAIENPYGSAPAFRIEIEGAVVWALPGVPEEFQGLVRDVVVPSLTAGLPAPPPPDRVWTFHGIPESTLDAWIVEVRAAEGEPPDHHICVHDGEIEVRSPGAFDLGPPARERFGSRLLGEGAQTLPERVIAEAAEHGAQVAVAESCTGGRIAARLTDVPGSSTIFGTGWVVYANDAKSRELGVSPALLEEHGAVSEAVARALAAGARDRSGARFSVSTTGIAGPAGGSPEKPVGTVWFGVATPDGVEAGLRRFRGDRSRVRLLAVAQALSALLAAIRGEDPFPWRTNGS